MSEGREVPTTPPPTEPATTAKPPPNFGGLEWKASAPPLSATGIGGPPTPSLATALHNKDWENAEQLVTPEAAAEKDLLGRLPLATAASKRAPSNVIARLIEAYPEATKHPDRFGDLPLVVALRQSQAPVSPKLAMQVLAAYPAAAREKDRQGVLPLVPALMHGADPDLVARLLNAFPGAVRETTSKDGKELPLSMAIRVNAAPEVVERILNEYPDAARERGQFGYLPLQVALRHYTTSAPGLIERLQELSPANVPERPGQWDHLETSASAQNSIPTTAPKPGHGWKIKPGPTESDAPLYTGITGGVSPAEITGELRGHHENTRGGHR